MMTAVLWKLKCYIQYIIRRMEGALRLRNNQCVIAHDLEACRLDP